MTDLFVGWDVGAWNCDRNRESRDSLCALALGDAGPKIVGSIWRGNLRESLVAREGTALVRSLLERMHLEHDEDRVVTMAIDTPLAWPKRMIDLVTKASTVNVPEEADANPYLFRLQELALFEQGFRPLSTVRDMIGSQSTKGIHFLKCATLSPIDIGVWGNVQRSVVAIETYPAAAVRDVEIARLTSQLLADLLGRERQSRSDAWQRDARDAITCALVALRHRLHAATLRAPHDQALPEEGWIWLPRVSSPAV